MAGSKQKPKRQYVVKSVNFKSGEDDDLINYFSARPDVIFSDFIKSLIREKAFSLNQSPSGILDSVIGQLNSIKEILGNGVHVSEPETNPSVPITKATKELKASPIVEEPKAHEKVDDFFELPEPVKASAPVKQQIELIQELISTPEKKPSRDVESEPKKDMFFDSAKMQPYYLASDGSRVYPMMEGAQSEPQVERVSPEPPNTHSDKEKSKPSVEDVSRMTSDEDAEVMSDIFDVINGGGTS